MNDEVELTYEETARPNNGMLWWQTPSDSVDRVCGRCGRIVKNKGWGSHNKACEKRWQAWARWVAKAR